MKFHNPLTGIVVITLLGLAASIATADDEVVDFEAEYTALENAASEDGQAWYLFARKARLAGEYEVAGDALAISSRKIVPPSAAKNLPSLSPTAPVKAPLV